MRSGSCTDVECANTFTLAATIKILTLERVLTMFFLRTFLLQVHFTDTFLLVIKWNSDFYFWFNFYVIIYLLIDQFMLCHGLSWHFHNKTFHTPAILQYILRQEAQRGIKTAQNNTGTHQQSISDISELRCLPSPKDTKRQHHIYHQHSILQNICSTNDPNNVFKPLCSKKRQ